MAEFRVVIVDDEPPARTKLKRFLHRVPDFDVVAEAGDGVEALERIAEHDPDLVFLDIQMPKLDGLSVASNLEKSPSTRIVFVTAHDEFAVRAFELNAIDYLLKPFDRERLARTLDRARAQRAGSVQRQVPELVRAIRADRPYPEQLMFRTERGIRVVRAVGIEWIEASGNHVKICTVDDAFIARQSLTNLQSQLDPRDFARIHRSHVVNVRRVRGLESLRRGDYELELSGGTRLRLSRSYKDAFLSLFKG